MDEILKALAWLQANYQSILANLILISTGITGIALLIPGEQPEKFLQKAINFLKRFSKK